MHLPATSPSQAPGADTQVKGEPGRENSHGPADHRWPQDSHRGQYGEHQGAYQQWSGFGVAQYTSIAQCRTDAVGQAQGTGSGPAGTPSVASTAALLSWLGTTNAFRSGAPPPWRQHDFGGMLQVALVLGGQLRGKACIFDGHVDLAAQLYPSLTTVRVPRYEMGREAVRQLLRRLAGETRSSTIISLGFQIIDRDSA